MSIYNIIPYCDNEMSVYTLITFVFFAGVVIFVWKYINCKFGEQKDCMENGSVAMNELKNSINELKIEMSSMKTSINSLEDDYKEIRQTLSEINSVLIEKL